ncbi:MAG: tRNA (adenosine(37)-N6)-threonylcarbamoyltransferase complex transferase subunit TsaD [Candidatus Kaiserbacteria bacterium]|nr:MAG: tRNA (adenosine(37)-N6)-threonylcarbamoyltransferase complex transferase subunit TsaD [Candidatus Kaiserbacteria bacterium]
MKILGIETSCDETAVCLIEGTGDFGPDFNFKILGNALASQAQFHAQFGGVFPAMAKREHSKNIVPLLKDVFEQCGIAPTPRTPLGAPRGLSLETVLEREPELLRQLVPLLETHGRPDVDAIAVTVGPGLEPCLWVGVNFARALSLVWNVPVVAVNHMEGHIVMSLMRLEKDSGSMQKFEFPVLALLISGGHTELILMRDFGSYEYLGRTRDDAAGEAFDKTARLIGLPYPGGPEIARRASAARAAGEVSDAHLPRPMIKEDNFDFSFSGLKTAVLRATEGKTLSETEVRKISREIEESIADVLVEKTIRAASAYGANTIVLGGGVSANTYIRERFADRMSNEANASYLLSSPPGYSTDNALMIALPGYFRAQRREFSHVSDLIANGNLRLTI